MPRSPEQRRLWRAANPEIARGYDKTYRDKNRAAVRERDRRLKQQPKQKAAAKLRKLSPEYRARSAATSCGHRVEVPSYPTPAVCECCGQLPTSRRGLALDHCHETGRFRGYVCPSCNNGLGLADSIERLKLRIEFLERAQIRFTATPETNVQWVYPPG